MPQRHVEEESARKVANPSVANATRALTRKESPGVAGLAALWRDSRP